MTLATIKFKRDTSFRNSLFTADSFAHPAKLDAQLLIWIVEKFSKAGETILDPMFGSGTTMLACMLGRNVIGVELEQKFVDMAKANWEKVKQRPQLGSTMGTCQIIQGDARQLEGLLGKSELQENVRVIPTIPAPVSPLQSLDVVVSSPPYAGGLQGKEKGWDKLAQDPSSNRYGRKRHPSVGQEYSDNPDNLGNLKIVSYLKAMRRVYRQCFRVLRPGGLMILVTKNFIREQKEIRLDLDTISLCEKSGFTFQERWYRELPAQSFWRVIYRKKYPDAPELKYEDVLVFKRLNGNSDKG